MLTVAKELVAVRFVRGFSPYQAGEVAAFPPEKARELLGTGYAELYESEKPSATDEPVDEAEEKPKPERDTGHRRKGRKGTGDD